MSLQVLDARWSCMTEATSAAGPMRVQALPWLICIAGALAAPGTASLPGTEAGGLVAACFEQTSSGVYAQSRDSRSHGSSIMELRRLSGLTWDQLARLFGTSRRTLHFWASGKTLNSVNAEKLQRVLATLRKIDRGSASENRTFLLTPHADGVIPLDLLTADQYRETVERAGAREAAPRPRLEPLSEAARAAAAPPRPHELVGALHDPVHAQKGRLLAATPIKTRRET